MQELVPAGTPIGGLPAQVERACCPGKSCGNTTLNLKVLAAVIDGEVVLSYTYVRASNDDNYWRPVDRVDDLIDCLNDLQYWPQDHVAAD